MVLHCNTVAWLIKINHIVSFEIRNLPVPIFTVISTVTSHTSNAYHNKNSTVPP